jgi:hypothetical protein
VALHRQQPSSANVAANDEEVLEEESNAGEEGVDGIAPQCRSSIF